MSKGFPRRQTCKGGKLTVRKEKLDKWIKGRARKKGTISRKLLLKHYNNKSFL